MVDWTVVTPEHVHQACQLYDNGREMPVRSARNTFLLFRGKKYPAKHIRGLAYRLATRRTLNPSVYYSGGMETVRFFNRLGFDVEYSGELNQGRQPRKDPPASGASRPTHVRLKRDPQKIAFRNLLEQLFGYVVLEAKFDWLLVPDSASMDHALAEILDALTLYRGYTDFYSPGQGLRVDYYIPSQNIIIEYDERQHFTVPRAIALKNYPRDLLLGFDKDEWISHCNEIQAADNDPYYRDEQRAFYDSLRDLLCYRQEINVIRIKDKDVDWTGPEAVSHLNKIITRSIPQVAAPIVKRGTRKYQLSSEQWSNMIKVALVVPVVWDLKTKATFHIPRPSHLPLKYEPIVPKADEFGQDHIDLIVFPESYILDDDEKRLQSLRTLAKELETYIIVGASQRHKDRKAYWETLLLFPPRGEERTLYYKHATAGAVAFEFSDWNSSKHLPVFDINGAIIGCTICQDSYLGLLQRYLAQHGANIWINPSYDNVRPEKWEPIHQLRSIENGMVSLCTLHDNHGRLDKNGRPHRTLIRPFGFRPDGCELYGYPPDRPLEEKPLSQCTTSGIYVVKCPISPSSCRANPILMPETNKQSHIGERNDFLVRISIQNGKPKLWNGNTWASLMPNEPTQVHGIKLIMGLLNEEDLFDTAKFTRLIELLYSCDEDGNRRAFLWNLWSSLEARPAQLVNVMLGRTLEFGVPIVLSDYDTIYEITERAGGTKTMRRISLNNPEGKLSLKFAPREGLWNSFDITWRSLTDISLQIEDQLDFLNKYRSLE